MFSFLPTKSIVDVFLFDKSKKINENKRTYN